MSLFDVYDISITNNITMVFKKKNHIHSEKPIEKAKGRHAKVQENFGMIKLLLPPSKVNFFMNSIKL